MELNNNLVIRDAEEKDIPQILALTKELAEYEKLSDSVLLSEELLKKYLFSEKRYAEVLIAEYDGETAGHALYFYNYSTFAGKPGIYLEDLYVRPPFRSKGIGKSLLKFLIAKAKEEGCGRVEWAVLDWNTPAISFYRKIGAVPMDEWTIFRLTEDKF